MLGRKTETPEIKCNQFANQRVETVKPNTYTQAR